MRNSNDKPPYVHKFTLTLEVMPFLAQGSNAVVFDVIGLLEPERPEGVTEQDVANFICKGLATVRSALTNLLSRGLIETVSEGHYLTNATYMCWGKRDKGRDFTASGDFTDPCNSTAQNFLSHKNIFVPQLINSSTSKEINLNSLKEELLINLINGDAENISSKEILLEAGANANILSEEWAARVSMETAQLWANWIEAQTAKNAEFGWAGVMVKELRKNAQGLPPGSKKPEAPRAKRPTVTGRLAGLGSVL